MIGDLRQAWRALLRRPLLFAVAAGALALGIGASTAVFSVVDAVLLRPASLADAGRLVLLWQSVPERNVPFARGVVSRTSRRFGAHAAGRWPAWPPCRA